MVLVVQYGRVWLEVFGLYVGLRSLTDTVRNHFKSPSAEVPRSWADRRDVVTLESIDWSKKLSPVGVNNSTAALPLRNFLVPWSCLESLAHNYSSYMSMFYNLILEFAVWLFHCWPEMNSAALSCYDHCQQIFNLFWTKSLLQTHSGHCAVLSCKMFWIRAFTKPVWCKKTDIAVCLVFVAAAHTARTQWVRPPWKQTLFNRKESMQ